MWHYLIIGVVVGSIVVLQFYFYHKNKKGRYVFGRIFPIDIENETTINKQGKNVERLDSAYKNEIWIVIIDSINKYLSNNKDSVCDFHLIKDIIDRNCDAKEDDIQTQIPVPLYLGLVGTMAGILIGILILWLSGGLHNLLTAGGENDAEGVEALLGGVALAMISSICGIVLTTRGSLKVKTAKVKVEKGKNAFLSWIQAKLLPELSNDIAGVLQKMTRNLSGFNNTFAANSRELKDTLATITSFYHDVSTILTEINNMKVAQIASANVKVYDKLKNCTDEIGKLGDYLQNINKYQANTTEAIERMRVFFTSGVEQIDGINIEVRKALERFSKDSNTYLAHLQEELDSQMLEMRRHFEAIFSQMRTAAIEQQEIFGHKLKETTILIEELKNLSAVRNSMKELVTQTVLQSRQIDQLTKAINELAEMKVSGGVARSHLSVGQKIAFYAGGGVIVSYCLFELIIKISSKLGIILWKV